MEQTELVGAEVPTTAKEVGMPGLERVDQKPFGLDIPDPELERRRFSVAIHSVYYHPGTGGRVGCAILLKTSFELRKGEKLAHATVPLTARSSQLKADDTDDDNWIDILKHHPHEGEVIRVGRKTGSKTVFLVPSIKATVLGTGIEGSGVGVQKHKPDSEDRVFIISLRPQLKKFGNDPTCLKWEFEDNNPKGVYYPPDTSLLLIVEKHTSGPAENWFKFELRLELGLQVDIHPNLKDMFQPILRLMAGSVPHKGWCFQIVGNYNPKLAKTALEKSVNDAGELQIPPGIGLHAAATRWLKATSSPKNDIAVPSQSEDMSG